MPKASKNDRLENPLWSGIIGVRRQFGYLRLSGWSLIPSLVPLAALCVVLATFVVLLPYGFFPVVGRLLWRLLKDTRDEMLRESGLVDRMPGVVAMGIYFLVWLPFAIVSLPFVVLGLVGWVFSEDGKESWPWLLLIGLAVAGGLLATCGVKALS
jgi:hypothetical protein